MIRSSRFRQTGAERTSNEENAARQAAQPRGKRQATVFTQKGRADEPARGGGGGGPQRPPARTPLPGQKRFGRRRSIVIVKRQKARRKISRLGLAGLVLVLALGGPARGQGLVLPEAPPFAL